MSPPTRVPRGRPLPWTALCALGLCWSACAGAKLTPEQAAQVKAGDCKPLLLESDVARADHNGDLALALVKGCPQSGLSALVKESDPAQALLWCGRARAAIGPRGDSPACDVKRISDLREALKPKLTLGPADEAQAPDPLLQAALLATRKELNLLWDPDPDIIIGKLTFETETQDSASLAPVTDKDGKKRRVPGIAHRLVARCTGEVALGGRTRTLRATAEARDLTWDAVAKYGVAAKEKPDLPTEDAIKGQAAESFLKLLAKALAVSPPETVDLDDARGCVAYGLALNATSGDSEAAARRKGDTDRLDACEKILGEPEGAGIPVP